MKLNMGLDNPELYSGCEIKEVAGKLVLVTPPEVAANRIGRNAAFIAEKSDKSEVTLTGAMAVWAYLVVFHVVVHRFSRVYYDDGKGNVILLAQH